IERAGRTAARLTMVRARAAAAPPRAVLVVDTIGELETYYGIADVVFVGGSLVPRGGHNMLEPAALGKPTLFGPHTDNFADDVRLLVVAGGGIVVRDAAALQAELARLLERREAAAELAARGRAALTALRGGTRKSVELVNSLLEN